MLKPMIVLVSLAIVLYIILWVFAGLWYLYDSFWLWLNGCTKKQIERERTEK